MLQHSELPGDCGVPVGHGGHNLWSGFDGWCVCCSILNSLVIVVFLSGMVAMIMLRTLHKDIARYNQMDNAVSAHTVADTAISALALWHWDEKCESDCHSGESECQIFRK